MTNSNDGHVPAEATKSNRLPGILAGLIILIISVALYYKTVGFEFVYDDIHIIAQNQNITSLKDDPSGFLRLYSQEFWAGVNQGKSEVHALFQPKGQALYRPVMLTAIGLVYYLVGEDPGPFHIMNIIVNALVCLLVFMTVKRLFGSMRMGFFAGLIFACHPIHTEAVCYITGLGELLGMLFLLLALLFYLKASYNDQCTEKTGFRILPYLVSLVFFMIGLFSKENVITLVGVLIVYDFIMAINGRRPFGLFQRVGMYLGYFCIIGINLLARFNAIGSLKPGEQNPIDNVIAAAENYPMQLWTALKVMGKALWLTILPLNLSPDYSYAAITLSNGPFEADVLSAMVFIFCLLVIGFAVIRKIPAISFGIFWFFITFFLVSNVVLVVGTIFGERLLYTPSLGICLVLAFIIDRIFHWGGGKQKLVCAGSIVGSILLVGIAALGSMKTLEESKKWEDSEFLFQAAAEVVPESSRVHFQLAQMYTKNKYYTEAEKEYMTVLRIDRSFHLAHVSLGDLYIVQGQHEKALMVFQELRKNLGDTPQNADLIKVLSERLAHCYSVLQKTDEAIDELIAISKYKDNPALDMQIGDLYSKDQDFENAAKYYQKAWDRNPEKLDAAYRLLGCYRQAQDKEKQDELLDRLEELDKNSSMVHNIRAEIYMNDFELDKALEEVEKAIAKSPQDPGSYILKAQVLQGQLRLEDALDALDKAVEYCPPQNKAIGLLQKLEIYKQLQNMEMAEKTAEQLKELPLTPNVKSSLGDLYVQTGRYQEAAQYLREAIAGGMKFPPNFINLGKALSELGKFEDVISLLSPAVDDMKMNDPELQRILGGAMIAVENYERGIELLQESLRNWGPNPWTKLQIASAKMALKKYEDVPSILDALETKFKVPEIVPMVHHLRARLLLENEATKNPDQAAQMAQKAIDAMTPELYSNWDEMVPDFYITKIEALKAGGKSAQATQLLEEARQKFPDSAELKNYGASE